LSGISIRSCEPKTGEIHAGEKGKGSGKDSISRSGSERGEKYWAKKRSNKRRMRKRERRKTICRTLLPENGESVPFNSEGSCGINLGKKKRKPRKRKNAIKKKK